MSHTISVSIPAPFIEWREDAFSNQLFDGDGFKRFIAAPKMRGLARIGKNGRLEILAIESDEPNRGHCRAFFESCESIYKEIIVWEVWNEGLSDWLKRRGYFPYMELENDGGTCDGLRRAI